MKSLLYCSPNPIGVSPRQLRTLEELSKANIPIVILETAWVYKGKWKQGIWPFVEKREYSNRGYAIDRYSVKFITLELNKTKSIFSILNIIFSLFVYSILWLLMILYLVPKLKVGIVWCSNAPDLPCAIVAIVKKIFRNKLMYIYEMRELTPELYCIRARGDAHCPFYGALRLLERIAYSSADIVITVSSAMKEYVCRIYKNTPKIVIPLYPFPPYVDKFANKLEKSSSRRADKITAIYGGSILENIYDLPLLLEALIRLYPKIRNNFQLLVIGKGDSVALQRVHHVKNKIPEVIEYSDFLPPQMYYQKLKEADMCIVPLKLNQLTSVASPNKLIDCIIMGKVVVTSALPSTIELAKRFSNLVILYKPESIDSLSETIIKAIQIVKNSNIDHNEFHKFSKIFYNYFSQILNAIKMFSKYVEK